MASSVASAPTTSILNSLPTRPPTPPREAGHDADVSLRSVVLGKFQSFDPRRSLHTPPGASSPASFTGSDPSSSRMRKKVEWSSHTEYKEPPDYHDGARLDKLSPLSAPSSGSSKPIKGILKPSSSLNPLASALGSQLDGTEVQPNIIEMLDSTIKHLAGPDRDSKLDAYMMLARALKASDNLPDRVALQNKMSLFMQFIQRDITAKNELATLDSSLVKHALSLLATFLHFQAIASTLTSDFGVFIIDHAIRSFEDATMPKDVIRHLMQVVAFQNFSPKVMTPDRVGRLVAALHDIENHVKGKSIVMSRLHTYKRLLNQARNFMVTHSNWLKDMFTDMLSTIKDIRAQAISLGTEAGFALRSDKLLFRKAAELFKAADDKETYIDFYIRTLQGMMEDKQTSSAVPQIWSVVILFLPCPLDRWQYYGPWLTLVQSAFNMADGMTKQEANFAWNRYVYLSILDSKMHPKGLATLCKPLLSQLRRRTGYKKQQDEAVKLRRVVMGGVCSLYYHAFAQGDDRYPIKVIWDVAVQPVMELLTGLEDKPDVPGDCMMQAARLLVGLLDVSTPRPPRNTDRIMDTAPLKPEELWPIDPKWVRQNCGKVLQAVAPIMEKKFLDLANKESLVFRLWQSMVGSIAAASAKDIKVSDDTAKFLACSFGLLSKAWSRGSGGDEGLVKTKFLPSVKHFVQLLNDGLRVLPFTEKKLSMSALDLFESVAAPLQRLDKSEKARGPARVPLHHLFSMLSSTPAGCADDEDLATLFQSVFDPFFRGRSVTARAELARELIHLLPRNALAPFGPWVLAAENMKLSLGNSPSGSGSGSSSSDKLLGPEYRQVVSLLERGLTCHPNLPATRWKSFFDLVSTNAVQECGDAGHALVVIEPLAKVLLDDPSTSSGKPSNMSIQAMTMLFYAAKMPRDRQALDAARLRLWGAPPAVARAGPSDPFDNLYKLGNHMMKLFYDSYADFDVPAEVDAFIESVDMFLERCSPQVMMKTVAKLQHGLCRWLQDERTRLQLHDKSSISKTLCRLWARVCTEMASNGQLEKKDLELIEPLLTAAFKSKNGFIVGRAADAWNALVKDEDQIEGSEALMSIISSLRSDADLVVSGVDPSNGDFGAQASSLTGHAKGQSLVALWPTTSRHSSCNGADPPVISLARKRRMETTPEIHEKPPKRTTPARLRHDDSQIQFATIAPSSLPHDESQHLTDRQKEVRERQRENAALFSDRRCSPSPPCSASMISRAAETSSGEGNPAKETTPTHKTSFDDLISSTPTPRRGQVLPMDDVNDPPSSPPVPRPYPLLPEILSRSKPSSSLGNWEFSSPAGSPVARLRRAAHDVEPADLAADEDSLSRRRQATPKQRQPIAKNGETTNVIPSSITDDSGSSSVPDSQAKGSASPRTGPDPPATPPQRHLMPPSRVEGTPRSVEEEFVDSRSSPERPWPRQVEASGESAPSRDDMNETSFALSEGDESRMMNLVVELESRRYELPLTSDEDSSPGGERVLEGMEKEKYITAYTTPLGIRSRRGSRRLASLMIASTPPEAAEKEAEGRKKRKRRRGASGSPDGGGKRRRSAEPEVVEDQGEEATKPDSAASMTHSTQQSMGTAVRRSSRKRKQRTVAATGSGVVATKRPSEGRDTGDTHEEVVSQLVTESAAASQQSHQQRAANKAADKTAGNATGEAAHSTLASRTGAEPGEEAGKAAAIMETLRSGLGQLREAALGRDDVYQLEDVLMDMKRELYEAESRGRKAWRQADEEYRLAS